MVGFFCWTLMSSDFSGEEMSRTISCFLCFVLFLSACGDDGGNAWQITGSSTIATNACTAYTMTKSNGAVSSATTVQPSLQSGQGSLYSDSGCSTFAALNIQIAAGGSSANFYFKSSSAGTTVISMTDVTNMQQNVASITVTVQ